MRKVLTLGLILGLVLLAAAMPAAAEPQAHTVYKVRFWESVWYKREFSGAEQLYLTYVPAVLGYDDRFGVYRYYGLKENECWFWAEKSTGEGWVLAVYSWHGEPWSIYPFAWAKLPLNGWKLQAMIINPEPHVVEVVPKVHAKYNVWGYVLRVDGVEFDLEDLYAPLRNYTVYTLEEGNVKVTVTMRGELHGILSIVS